jgi:uncharacterized membrane protein YdbT with pleckstrin-like domain
MSALQSHRPRRVVRTITRQLTAALIVVLSVLVIVFAFSHAWTVFIIIPGLWVLAGVVLFRRRR